MKKKLIGIAVICTALVLSVFGYYGFSSADNVSNADLAKLQVNSLGTVGAPGGFKTLSINTDTSKIPQAQQVYKVVKPQLDKNKIKQTALGLGIDGDVQENNVSFQVKGATGDFVVDKATGSERYSTLITKGEVQYLSIKNPLADSEYVRLANEFLAQHGFAKPGMELKGVHYGAYIGRIDENGNYKQTPVKVEVMFISPTINGIKYTGVGPKISVWFGSEGQIIGYASIWREIEPFHQYPIITPNQAAENVKNGKGLVYNVSSNAEEGVVDSVELALWSDPNGMTQDYVLPHYIMKGKNQDGKDFTIVTRAVSEEYLAESTASAPPAPVPDMVTKP